MPVPKTNQLYYITHKDNVASILQRGILSHAVVESEGIKFVPIYNEEIVSTRKERRVDLVRTLWDFANLYFQPRNPMLYKVLLDTDINNIVVIAVDKSILGRDDIYLSNGNAASPQSELFPQKAADKVLKEIYSNTRHEYWTEEAGLKRKIMAECLVPDQVQPRYITTIYVATHETRDEIRALVADLALASPPETVYDPEMFFRARREEQVTESLFVVEGDMFFSRQHTLTISVNTVGVMGKGLASRAKYQFPDVYVHYQDLCKNRVIQMGKPYLYKRESSLDFQLADEPATLNNGPSETWFLLFATKTHWKEPGDLPGIERGLQWVVDHYQTEGIKSLALPALGCGLGGLDWREVGPLMCRYLRKLTIPVRIYLPGERRIPPLEITPTFLLGK